MNAPTSWNLLSVRAFTIVGQPAGTLVNQGEFSTDIPARLDRLPWATFHWLIVTALGITWILDGLEVTLVGSLSGAIAQSSSLHLTATRIGLWDPLESTCRHASLSIL